MYKKIISLIAVSALFFGATVMAHTIAKKGMKADLVLMPKFLGILVFDQANNGAQEAHRELGNPGKLEFLGPTPENSVAGQIEILTTATTQGQDGIMISNNAGDQIAPAAKAARAYSGVRVARVKTILFMMSGLISALAGILFAARLGSVRGDMGLGFELDIITMVLLGGVSIFGGSGSIYGVILSILIVLYLRNGMSLMNVTGHIQTGVIGVILILSAMIPNIKTWLEGIFEKKYAS